MEVGQLCNVVVAIAPDGPNALELLSGLLLCYPSQAILVDTHAGDGLDLLEPVQAEGLQESEPFVSADRTHTWLLLSDDCMLCNDMRPARLEYLPYW